MMAEVARCGAIYDVDLIDVTCQLEKSHDGPHSYTVTWNDYEE